ncbi:MAG: SpoIIE family protein phosphatase, partial [Lachnospiraceae bacterium]|nr:SpoIIE family protein phosphatase [Lachnospiraceae bacterium]
MVGSPMGTVGWALISAFSEQVAAQPITEMQESYEQIQQEAVTTYRSNINRSRNRTLLILLLILLVLLANALVLGKRIVKPLNSITKRIFELNESNLEFKMEDTFRTGDEIQTLAESFADLSHKTVVYMDQVRNVTAEKERIGTELRMANQIQESVLPNIFPAFPDREEFDIYATMDPAKEVGGDFYDFFLIDKDHLGIVIADVSGKGVPAALFMMAS